MVRLATSQGRIVQSRASSAPQRFGWQGTMASAGLEFACNRRPHSSHICISRSPLFLLARQAAEITQHQHDGARIGQRIAALLLGRQLDSRGRGPLLENR